MCKREKLTSLLLAAFLLAVLLPGHAGAEGFYSVRAVIPENQVSSNTYFDLLVQPGDRQTLEVVVTNSTGEDAAYDVALNAAGTGRNGVILYSGAVAPDEHAADITEMAALRDTEIEVPAGESRSVLVDLRVPDEPLDGVVLGGVVVSQREPEETGETDPDRGVYVDNRIDYVLGIKLTQDEAGRVEQDFALKDIRADLVNYHPAVIFSLQNPAPAVVRDMEIEAQVYAEDGREALHGLTLESASMAPGSTGEFVIDWEDQAVDRGDYVLYLTASHEGQTWTWEEPFTIGREAGEINGGAVAIERSTVWVYVLIAVLAAAAVGVIAYSMGRRRNS